MSLLRRLVEVAYLLVLARLAAASIWTQQITDGDHPGPRLGY